MNKDYDTWWYSGTVVDIITFFRFSNRLPYVFDSFISESLQYKQMMSAIK